MTESRPRNVLLLIADDLGLNLGCYNNTAIHTPHLDALAQQGTRFTHAFTSTASCSGSRSVIYTGLHTHTNGQYGLQHSFHHFMTHDHVDTLPGLFNDAGYLTGIVGKVHVGPDHVYPWQVRWESGTRNVAWCARQSAAFFAEAKEQNRSFHLTVGFMDPHRDNTRGGFANADAPYDGVPDREYSAEEVEVPNYIQDLPAVRTELAEYYRAITRMDQGVGQILAALDDAGLRDSTMIVFCSDNGAPFLNSKTTLYDAGIRLPLIVRVPGTIQPATSDAMVSFCDLLPTFLDWAHVGSSQPSTSTSPTRTGRSILPLLRGTPPSDWPTAVFGSHTFHELTNYYPTRIVRTTHVKYHRNVCWKLDFPFSADLYASKSWQAIRNASQDGTVMIGQRPLAQYVRRGAEELYDIQADPLEVRNLAAEPEYADVVLDLRKRLEQWQRETEDPWLFRDGVSVRSMAQFIGQDGGWTLQDRFDFELDQPHEPEHVRACV